MGKKKEYVAAQNLYFPLLTLTLKTMLPAVTREETALAVEMNAISLSSVNFSGRSYPPFLGNK